MQMKLPIALTKAFLAFFLTMSFCAAQTQELDSIKNLMKTATDTALVTLIRQQGHFTRPNNIQKALELYQRSVEKSKELEFAKGEIMGLFQIGRTYGMAGNYPEALSYLRQSLALATTHKEFEDISLNYSVLGVVYKRIGDYSTSQDYYLKNLKLADSLQLHNGMSNTYLNLGVLYDLMGQQEKAIASYEKALEVAPPENRPEKEQIVLVNLAVMDFENRDYEAALDKFLKGVAYEENQNDEISLSNLYSNVGMCYLELNQWKQAEEYLKKSLQLAEKLSLQQEAAVAWQNLADLRLHQKRYAEAIDYSDKNLKTLDAMAGSFEQRKEAHEIAFQIYEESGQLQSAVHHLNLVMAYKDSLLNETKVREIQNLQVQHDVYLKDRELKENELQLALLNTRVALNSKRMIYLSIIAFLFLFSAGLLYFRFRAKKRANAQLQHKNELISEQNQVIEEMNLKLEKQMLRAQMNPHFIFNSLNSIQHLINSNDRINALKYLSKFSKLLRNVLESSINIVLTLHEEIELLKIYIELESLRFDDSFCHTIHVDENLDVYQHEVPMLLVQPYIENAILHGLMPKKGPKKLSISFMDKKGYIGCVVEDNGVGFSPKVNHWKSKSPSRGMSITSKRIDALKKFSNEELLKVENLNNGENTGTKVTILIPKDQ